MVQYEFNNKLYTVVPCVKTDIPSHFERVSLYWDDDIKELQKERMNTAIEANSTYKIVDEEGNSYAFLYMELTDNPREGIGIAFWFENKRFFAMLGRYLRLHKYLTKIYFMPHDNSYIPFQFAIPYQSIQEYRWHNTPLAIYFYSQTTEYVITKNFEKYDIKEIVV